jgi:hypothetical protein
VGRHQGQGGDGALGRECGGRRRPTRCEPLTCNHLLSDIV